LQPGTFCYPVTCFPFTRENDIIILKQLGFDGRFVNMANVTLNKVIEDFRKLPLPEREYVIEIIGKQLIEAKREAIFRRAKRTIPNLKKGAVKKGTVKELYEDLELE
jgi:hypothetical protein